MKTKQLFFNALTVCTLALAVLLSQAMFNASATAENPEAGETINLLQKVQDLEKRQEQNDLDFFLVDQSLNDLDARVNENDKRGLANLRSINQIDGRLRTAIAVQKADHRALVKSIAALREMISK